MNLSALRVESRAGRGWSQKGVELMSRQEGVLTAVRS